MVKKGGVMVIVSISTVIAVIAVLGFLLSVFNSILEAKLDLKIGPVKRDIAKLEAGQAQLEAGQAQLRADIAEIKQLLSKK